MTDRLLAVPQAAWRTLAALTLLAGVFVPTVRAPVITLGSAVGNAAILSVVALLAYWFVRVAMGFFFFSLLASISERFVRAFIVFALVVNAIGCIPLLLHPLMSPEPIDDPETFAVVPAIVLGFVYLLRQDAGAPYNKALNADVE